MNEQNTVRGAGKQPSFTERAARVEAIADAIAALIEDGAMNTAEFREHAQFLAEEALRMQRTIARFKERDQAGRGATRRDQKTAIRRT